MTTLEDCLVQTARAVSHLCLIQRCILANSDLKVAHHAWLSRQIKISTPKNICPACVYASLEMCLRLHAIEKSSPILSKEDHSQSELFYQKMSEGH
jgi:hypothetical protein